MGRIMLPLYAVMILASCLFAVNMRLNMNGIAKFIVEKFAIITGILFGAAVLIVGVVMVVMVIQRFYKNLLGTEGYLMFTIPAKTHEHILSKAISAFLWIIIGVAAGVVSGFAMIAITSNVPEFLRQVQEAWRQISPDQSVTPIVWFIISAIVGVMENLIRVYAAIAVGHQFNSHRLAGAIVAFFGFGLVELLLSILMDKLHLIPGGLFASTSAVNGIQAMQLGVVFSLIGIAVYGLLCWYLLDRRLNLE